MSIWTQWVFVMAHWPQLHPIHPSIYPFLHFSLKRRIEKGKQYCIVYVTKTKNKTSVSNRKYKCLALATWWSAPLSNILFSIVHQSQWRQQRIASWQKRKRWMLVALQNRTWWVVSLFKPFPPFHLKSKLVVRILPATQDMVSPHRAEFPPPFHYTPKLQVAWQEAMVVVDFDEFLQLYGDLGNRTQV